MLAICAAVAAWLLLPQDLRYFGGSLFAMTRFSSNIFFWLEAGYFGVAAERKPPAAKARRSDRRRHDRVAARQRVVRSRVRPVWHRTLPGRV